MSSIGEQSAKAAVAEDAPVAPVQDGPSPEEDGKDRELAQPEPKPEPFCDFGAFTTDDSGIRINKRYSLIDDPFQTVLMRIFLITPQTPHFNLHSLSFSGARADTVKMLPTLNIINVHERYSQSSRALFRELAGALFESTDVKRLHDSYCFRHLCVSHDKCELNLNQLCGNMLLTAVATIPDADFDLIDAFLLKAFSRTKSGDKRPPIDGDVEALFSTQAGPLRYAVENMRSLSAYFRCYSRLSESTCPRHPKNDHCTGCLFPVRWNMSDWTRNDEAGYTHMLHAYAYLLKMAKGEKKYCLGAPRTDLGPIEPYIEPEPKDVKAKSVLGRIKGMF